MKGYFDKHIRNRFFWAAKLRSSQDFSDVTRQEIFPPLPLPRRRMPHPQRVEIIPCRRMRETQRFSIVPRLQYILTQPWTGYHSVKYVKRGALDCFTVVACEKRAAVGVCHWVGYEKRGAFLCPCVGAYCIRPTNDPPKGGEGPAFGRGQAFAIHGMVLCGAYAIRPYPDGRKMIAVGACSIVLPEKQAALRGCYGVGGGKCGAFSCPRVGAY